ncbi:MAG: tungstate transport system substrate-binding protein [Planctomycetota bacterium]|jgi:tungstate transport system substrate-binding protein
MSLLQIITILAMLLGACACDGSSAAGPQGQGGTEDAGNTLRLAVTTSTRDSGLLQQLVPPFEALYGVRVDVIAMGTGAALQQGRDGNVDALIVHSRAAEEKFMAEGHGVRREDLMSNSFELLGPPDDPAGIKGLDPKMALRQIASSGQSFVSRGDESGTHTRELVLWGSISARPTWDGYVESGQGMGATLTMANQMGAHVLCDRGTYLNRVSDIELRPLAAASQAMLNPYGAIAIDPDKHGLIRGELADAFLDYLILPTTQGLIKRHKVGGESLFAPAHSTD